MMLSRDLRRRRFLGLLGELGSIGHGSVVGTVFEHGVGKANDGE